MYQRVVVLMVSLLVLRHVCVSQNISGQLDRAIQKLSNDDQFKHAVISLYVIDGRNGNVVFEKNSQLGLSPASCQKVITSASAFELLGKGYQYKTSLDYDLQIDKGILKGNLYLTGSGDPTLGSDRWNSSSEAVVLKKILNVLQKNKVLAIAGDLVADDTHFTNEPLPVGWVWEDIGNYYGAGAWGLNWRENKFDVTFRTGNAQNELTKIISTKPAAVLRDYTFANFVRTGSKQSGDNAFLFSSPFHKNIIARGTVPMTGNGFTISGAMPDPPGIFIKRVNDYLEENGVPVSGNAWSNSARLINNQPTQLGKFHLGAILSPVLDSINYWFLKKSVNLFGEAFVKTIAFETAKVGSSDTGIALIKEFWSKHGIEKSALKIIDGSGLSPANRITTHSLVTVMQYAKGRPWFASFYNALPEMNGIKMKDGYIGGVRSYTGYLKSKNGSEYIFAFIVNNFDGNAGSVRAKMWTVLDILK